MSASRHLPRTIGITTQPVDTNLPLVLGFMDYQKREAGYGKCFTPSGDMQADLLIIEEFYKNIKGKHPEKYNPLIFERD